MTHYWQSPYVDWLREVPEGWAVLICHMRTARNKARVPAVLEALHLLEDFGARAPLGGPMADQKGVFWIAFPAPKSESGMKNALGRLPHLGYTGAVDLLEALTDDDTDPDLRWRAESYRLRRVYEEDAAFMRERAPDRREFLLVNHEGEAVPVRGYRGDGEALSRRGLNVYDARLLVNLTVRGAERFLDPFAGVGGVILEAAARDQVAVSVDNDPILRYGLAALADFHAVADAGRLPFAAGAFDAIGTEPPYDKSAGEIVRGALPEMARVLRPGGRMAVLCAEWQACLLRETAESLPLRCYLNEPVNRKGLGVVILAWEKV